MLSVANMYIHTVSSPPTPKNGFVWFSFVKWHISLRRLFNAKTILVEEQ